MNPPKPPIPTAALRQEGDKSHMPFLVHLFLRLVVKSPRCRCSALPALQATCMNVKLRSRALHELTTKRSRCMCVWVLADRREFPNPHACMFGETRHRGLRGGHFARVV